MGMLSTYFTYGPKSGYITIKREVYIELLQKSNQQLGDEDGH